MLQTEVTRSLAVPLTDAEVADRVREAKLTGDAIAELTAKIGRLAEDTKAAKADVDLKQREVKRLVRIADAREEDRDVKCRWSYDLVTNRAELVRLDSGEIVETRALTGEERRELEQRPLFDADQVLDEAARRFQAENPDVKVTVTRGSAEAQ